MKCSFCGKDITVGRGKMVVQTDGSVNYYCGSKCERNNKIRNPRNVKWTSLFHKEKKK